MSNGKELEEVKKISEMVGMFPKWLLLFLGISPLAAIATIVNFGVYKADAESRLFQSVEERFITHTHVHDETKHMPKELKDLMYMPRKEVELKFQLYNEHVKSIDEKFDILLKALKDK